MDESHDVKEVTIFVRLLDEGTDVFRPVLAHSLEDGSYEIDESQTYDREDEKWEFSPGTRVTVEEHVLSSQTVLVAISHI